MLDPSTTQAASCALCRARDLLAPAAPRRSGRPPSQAVDGARTSGDKPPVSSRVRPLVSRRAAWRLAAVAGVAALTLSPLSAWAQQGGPQQQAPGLPGADEIEEREGRPKPYADDVRSGHVYIDAVSSAVFPVGSIAPGASLTEVASFGVAVGGALGVGLSRHLELDARGAWGLLTGPTACETCSSTFATAGLGFTSHLTLGASIDPWIRLGVGYRMFELEHGADESSRVLEAANGTYHGVDIAQLGLGADFYPVPGFGLGPWLQVDMGSFVAWPDEAVTRGTRFYAFFMVGLELELDPVMWTSPMTPASTPATPPAKAAWAEIPRF